MHLAAVPGVKHHKEGHLCLSCAAEKAAVLYGCDTDGAWMAENKLKGFLVIEFNLQPKRNSKFQRKPCKQLWAGLYATNKPIV